MLNFCPQKFIYYTKNCKGYDFVSDLKKKLSRLIIPFPVVVGFLISWVSGSMDQMDFKNPPLTPPQWAFPVVWSILYLMMGISAYLVYKKDDYKINDGLKYFFYQLLINFVWPIIFFRFKMYATAAITLAILILLTVATICEFKKISKAAAWLMVPYLLWLCFALYLNIGVAVLN